MITAEKVFDMSELVYYVRVSRARKLIVGYVLEERVDYLLAERERRGSGEGAERERRELIIAEHFFRAERACWLPTSRAS